MGWGGFDTNWYESSQKLEKLKFKALKGLHIRTNRHESSPKPKIEFKKP